MRFVIADIISSMVPHDKLESEHLEFAKNWIASGAEICRRDQIDEPKIHLVVYFLAVDPELPKILLVDHKKARMWLPPGGHVHVDEHPKATVLREAKEELGIEAELIFEEPLFLSVTPVVDHRIFHTDVSLWYLIKANSQQLLQYDVGEFDNIRWYYRHEIPFDNAEPHLQRFLDKVFTYYL